MNNFEFANMLVNDAKTRYEDKKEQYEIKSKKCNEKLSELDSFKLQIWSSFARFIEIFNKIRNKPLILDGEYMEEDFEFSKNDLQDLTAKSNYAVDILASMGESAAAGALAGTTVLSSAAVLGAVSTMGLTFIGVSGGFEVATSMAAVWMSLYGISVSPLAVFSVPALAISGIFMHSKGKEKVEEAKKIEQQSDEICKKLNLGIQFFDELIDTSDNLYTEIKKINDFYMFKLNKLDEIVKNENDYSKYSEEQKAVCASTFILVKLLKKIVEEQVIQKKEENRENILANARNANEIVNETKEKRLDLIRKENSIFNNSADEYKYVSKFNENIGNKIICQDNNEEKEEYIIKEGNRDISKDDNVVFENKSIVVTKQLHVDGVAEFINCDIFLDYDGKVAIYIRGGKIKFKNCTFTIGKITSHCEIFAECGSAELDNCKIIEQKYANEGLIDYDWGWKGTSTFIGTCGVTDCPGKIVLKNMYVDKCSNCFVFIQGNAILNILNSTIKNHNGNFVRGQHCDSNEITGVIIKDTCFNNNVSLKEKRKFEDSEYECELPLIDIKSCRLELQNDVFSDIHNKLIFFNNSFCNVKDSIIENCKFNNIIFDGERKKDFNNFYNFVNRIDESDKNIYMSSNIILKNNIFENISNFEIGSSEFDNDSTVVFSNNIFKNYTGNMEINRIKMLECSFEDCNSMSIIIEGEAEKKYNYLSQIINTKFINCNSQSSIIGVHTYLKLNIVIVKGCQFKGCKAESKICDLSCIIYKSFGREEMVKVGIEENNTYDD